MTQMFKKINSIVWFSLILIGSSCNTYYQEDFSDQRKFSENWWHEGCKPTIINDRLHVDADTSCSRTSTVWLDKKINGDVCVEFEVQVIRSSDTANNINFFFLYSDQKGNNLKDTRRQRTDADYPTYHDKKGYFFTFVANGEPENGRIRFRRNPGFHLLQEVYGIACKVGKTYKVKIVKKKNRFQYFVDHQLIFDMEESRESLHEGIIGFRTWHTALWWDNLTIKNI